VRLPQTDIRPNTVELEFNLLIENYAAISGTPAEMQVVQRVDPIKIARDTGGGAFDSAVVGRIDYATGTVIFRPDTTVNVPFARYSVQQLGWTVEGSERRPVYRNTFSHWEYKPAGAAMPIDESGYVKVRYRSSDAASAATETVTLAQLEVDLTDRYAEAIVPGSVRFGLGGKVYVDRLGTLVTDINANTGAGTQAGTIDYASGRALLTVWQPGAGGVMSMQSLLTELGGQPVD
ncbi:hypothetical protein LBW56_25170, partial [Ralstonia solanacearum]|nr:hypothetical protein [Ralstonia solanacearum]